MRYLRKVLGLGKRRETGERNKQKQTFETNGLKENEIEVRDAEERTDFLSDENEYSNERKKSERQRSNLGCLQEPQNLLNTFDNKLDLDLMIFRLEASGLEVEPQNQQIQEYFYPSKAPFGAEKDSPCSFDSCFGLKSKNMEPKTDLQNTTPLTTSLDFLSENSRTTSMNILETESPEARDEDLDILELLYDEVKIALKSNLPCAAYSRLIELSELLFGLINRRVGDSISLEVSLLLNGSFKSNQGMKNSGDQNAPHSSQPSSQPHHGFKGLKFSSSRGNSGGPGNNNFSKSRVLTDLVFLNRNGVPVRSFSPLGGSVSGTQPSGCGGSRRWRYHITGKNASETTSLANLGYRRGKLFLESFPLLPGGKVPEYKEQPTQSKAACTDSFPGSPSASPHSKFFKLEEFPCIIFSQNCFPVSNSQFSFIKNRALTLESLKFPTSVTCLGLEGETRLSEFIIKLVTDVHIHRLRFTLFKCSSSYSDLVLALKMKKKRLIRGEEQQLYSSPDVKEKLEKDKSPQSDTGRPEWNSLGDSNLGMWWTMGAESEFLILCDYIVNTNPLNVVSIVNECDLHLQWAPFVTNSECLAYIGLYNQIVRHYSNMPWPIGLCQCSLYCVAIDVNRQKDEEKNRIDGESEPCIIITAVSLPDKADSVCGVKVKEAQSSASKLDILSLCFVIQSVPDNPSQTRISFLCKSNIPIPSFIPKAVPSFIAKQIGKSFFNNIIGIIEKFNSTPFYQRIHSDVEFYDFIRERLRVSQNTGPNLVQDLSPISKKVQKETKQKEELEESFDRKENGSNLLFEKKSSCTPFHPRPDHPLASQQNVPSERSPRWRYSADTAVVRMFPSF
ncbi:START-like domain containing protein [Cryptosporidium felis]|nr:START-like domain containing protein [Cryptosporidium felis]